MNSLKNVIFARMKSYVPLKENDHSSLNTRPRRMDSITGVKSVRRHRTKSAVPRRPGAKFRYKQAPLPAVSDRVYRAMHVRGCFNTTDIVMLSDADRSYVNTVIRRLVKAGHLAFAGWKPGVDGKQVRMLRVVHRDKFYLEFCR